MTAHKVEYTARAHTTGGRNTSTNPEQLFAAAWSTRFIDAMRLTAATLEITLPAAWRSTRKWTCARPATTSFLQARFIVRMPGLERDVADTLVDLARQSCPYSRATRGNIDLRVKVA